LLLKKGSATKVKKEVKRSESENGKEKKSVGKKSSSIVIYFSSSFIIRKIVFNVDKFY
jgi:hypothetical protein